jgi:NADH-quinone oxidoreductase subunit J
MDFLLITLFKWIAILSAIGVVNVHNPVHAILLLIAVFLCAGAILLILQAEFLALLYIVVYVGAIAVLSLFVIMCLNIKIVEITTNVLNYIPMTILFVVLLSLEISYFIGETFSINQKLIKSNYDSVYINWIDLLDSFTNIEVVGQALFIYQSISLILVGLILLVAMLGSIVLTLSHSHKVRRQVIWLQSEASYSTAVRLVC